MRLLREGARRLAQPEDASVAIRVYPESYLVKWCTPQISVHTHSRLKVRTQSGKHNTALRGKGVCHTACTYVYYL